MSDYTSLLDIVFGYPGLLALLVTGALFGAWRAHLEARNRRVLLDRLEFIKDGQYRLMSPLELTALHHLARQRGCRDRLTPALDAIRASHGLPLRRGHAWWLYRQIEGTIPWDANPPACTPGQGLGTHPLAPRLPL